MSIMRSVALVAIWDFFFIAIAVVAAAACLPLLISHGIRCTFFPPVVFSLLFLLHLIIERFVEAK